MKAVLAIAVVLLVCAVDGARIRKARSTPFNHDAPVSPAELYLPDPLRAVPTKVDWRTKGFVQAVINEQTCAMDVADAVTTNIAGITAVRTGSFQPLSVEELVDCVTGCEGAYIGDTYEWIVHNNSGNVAPNSSWPPVANPPGKCLNPSQYPVGAHITGYHHLEKSEKAMAAAVAQLGPIAIELYAMPLQTYTGGVLMAADCAAQPPDTAMAIVGYNLDAPVPYWIVKNQWGTAWGVNGYVYLQYGNNTCNVKVDPITAVL